MRTRVSTKSILQEARTATLKTDIEMPGQSVQFAGGKMDPQTGSIDGSDAREQDELKRRWLTLLDIHLTRHPSESFSPQRALLHIPDWTGFRASLLNGAVGELEYCHIVVDPHLYVNDNLPQLSQQLHMVVLQLSGTSTFSTEDRTVRIRPGDFLLLHRMREIRVEHETRVEQLALFNPLKPEDAMRFGMRNMQLRTANDDLGRMTFRWLRDACLTPGFKTCSASAGVNLLLKQLLWQVFGDTSYRRGSVHTRLTRQGIEDYIRQQLDNAELSPNNIAEAFGCSVRTLHRVFGGAAGDSLERFLWQVRIEACTQALRDPQEASTTLLELALRHGFSSPAHFSALFRRTHGITPSEYRRRCIQG